jgi:LmbE family N-acetylglucosaminyl deacetylase
VTGISVETGWKADIVERRRKEIETVAGMFGFDRVTALGLPAAGLDRVAKSELVIAFSKVLAEFCPEQVFVPYPYDVHTDHRAVFDAAASCTKSFRCP